MPRGKRDLGDVERARFNALLDAARVRYASTGHGWQARLAEQLGVSGGQLSHLLAGRKGPSTRVFMVLDGLVNGRNELHRRITVCDEGTDRYVECTDCEVRLDAIAVIAEYADGDRSMLSTLEHVREARKRASEEHEQIRKATEALKRHRSSAIAKDPLLATLVELRRDVARELRGHPDQGVARLRAGIRDRLTHLITKTMKAIEAVS